MEAVDKKIPMYVSFVNSKLSEDSKIWCCINKVQLVDCCRSNYFNMDGPVWPGFFMAA